MRLLRALRWLGLPLALALAVCAALAAFLATLPREPVVVSVTADTEIARVEVRNPETAALALVGARDGSGACLPPIVLEPDRGAMVRYERLADGSLIVSVQGPSAWRTDADPIGAADEFAYFQLTPSDPACPTNRRVRLPLNGIVELGAEPAIVTDTESVWSTLLRGEIEVYGRAVSSIGPVPLTWAPFTPNALYLAHTSPIPSGSRLAGAYDSGGAPARWWGFADVSLDPANDAGPMHVEAATNAAYVDIFAQAPALGPADALSGRGAPDRITLSFTDRLVRDPNLRWIGFLATVLLSVLGLLRLRSPHQHE